jgi:hypothetical protein
VHGNYHIPISNTATGEVDFVLVLTAAPCISLQRGTPAAVAAGGASPFA